MTRLLVAGMALVCAACVSQPAASQRGANQRVVGRYLGLVEVTSPAPVPGEPPGVVRRNVRVLGGWLETSLRSGEFESAGVGWRESRQLVVPMDCRLIVIVRSPEDLASVRALLGADGISKGELCVIPD